MAPLRETRVGLRGGATGTSAHGADTACWLEGEEKEED